MKIKNLLVLRSSYDLKELGGVIWDRPVATRYDEGILNHKGNKKYPQYYKYYSSFDPHCCGEYTPISKTEFESEIQIIIEEYQEKIEQLKSLL